MYSEADVRRLLAQESDGVVTDLHKVMRNTRRLRHNFYVNGVFAAAENYDGTYDFVNNYRYLNTTD